MRRRSLIRVLAALLVLVGAVGTVVHGTQAAFTSEASASFEVSTGSLALSHVGNALAFDSGPLAPGDSAAATVRVTTRGSVPATLALVREHVGSTSPGGCDVLDALHLVVVEDADGDPDTTGDRRRVVDAALADVPETVALGGREPGEARSYAFTFRYVPQGGDTAADNDNCFQGAVDRERFRWTAVERPA